MRGNRRLAQWLGRVERRRFIPILDWIIEYGIYLLAIFQFQSKGEAFRSAGLYAPLVAWSIKLCLVRESRPKPSAGTAAFLLFTSSLFLSALFSVDALVALRGFRKTILKSAIVFYVVSQNFASRERQRRLGWVLACCGCIAVVAGFVNYLLGFTEDGGMAAFGAHRNGFASILGYLIPFILAHALISRASAPRLFFAGFFLVSLAAMLLTVSRGGWISLLISLGIWWVLLLKTHARLLPRAAAVAGVVILLTLLAFPHPIIARIASLRHEGYTLHGRIQDIWVPILGAVRDRPLLGWGPSENLAAQAYPTYYRKAFAKDPTRSYYGIHSYYLTILFYGGLLALATYVVFISIFLSVLLKKLRTAPPSERCIAVAVLSSFVSVFLVHGMVEGLVWWIPFGLILGLGESFSRSRSEQGLEGT